jgi:hypothetical protein
MAKLHDLRNAALALISTESRGLTRRIARLREAVRRKPRA